MSVQNRSICVVGLGYIGLPTASFLGTKGYKVFGVDVSPEIVNTINGGSIHFSEPDLDVLVKSAVHSGNLSVSTEPSSADIFIIAVPTPLQSGHQPNLSYVETATKAIAPLLKPGNLVILESTSPVGTTKNIVARDLASAGVAAVGTDVFVAHCPERVLPGRILVELVENDRIVGGISDASTECAAEFYKEFIRGEVFKTDSATAEMVKLVENSYRDVNIAFANEISMICDKFGINVWDVIELANKHPRVRILNPGPGVGGHCIAVDPWFVVSTAPDYAKLIRTARQVNDSKPEWVIRRVTDKAKKFRNPVIGCLGLAFKADVSDLRESPALAIARRLRDDEVGQLLVCEPNIRKSDEFPLVSLEEVIAASDIVLLLVDHKQFRKLTASDLKEKIVIDTRGVLR